MLDDEACLIQFRVDSAIMNDKRSVRRTKQIMINLKLEKKFVYILELSALPKLNCRLVAANFKAIFHLLAVLLLAEQLPD